MKPDNAIEIYPAVDLTLCALEEALRLFSKDGKHDDIYELRCASFNLLNALEIAKLYNTSNVGFFIKVTVDWYYDDCNEWSLRCIDKFVWSPGA